MTNFWLIGIVELLILFLAVGLVLRYYAHLQPKTTYLPSHYPPKRGFLSGFTEHKALWLFIIGLFIAIFGSKGVTNSYYDYLTTTLLFISFWMVWFTALVITGFFVFDYMSSEETRFGRFFIYLIVLLLGIFIFGVSVLVAIPESFPNIKGLFEGPVFSEDIIQGKTTSYDRSGPNYYVDIDNQHFHVPNSKWWQTFEKGKRIAYAYNPYSGGFSESIFHPDEINFTLPGMIIITDLILLWGITIWASTGGYIYFIFHKPVRDYYSQGKVSSYPTPHFQPQYHQAENTSKRSSCLPVLGLGIGVAALLLVVWKRLFTKTSK